MYNNYPIFDKSELLEYLRKSRSDDPSLSVEEVLEKHEAILNEYAENHLNGHIPEENIYREIKSSETIDDRPEMLKLLKRIESPKIKGILVVEPQRLTRGDLEDIGRLTKLLRYTNTYVITTQKIYDLRDEDDRDAFERELKRGNDRLEYAKKIMHRGKETSIKQGNYIYRLPPYGYNKTYVQEGRKKCPTLIENPEQANIVRMIFDMYVNKDMGSTSIADYLNDRHIKPMMHDKWSPETIRDMISNVHYIGKTCINKRETVKYVEDQEVLKSRPRTKFEELITYDAKHKGIISEELFYAAQEKRKTRQVPKKKACKVVNPFAGIFYCAICGRPMKYRAERGKYKPRFECVNMKYCGNGSAQAEEIIQRVIDTLKDCIADFEVKLTHDDAKTLELHNNMIKSLEERLEALNKKELSQWEKYTEERMPKEIFDKLNEKVLKEKEEVQEAICTAKNSMPEPVDYGDKIVKFQDALNALQDPDVSAEAKNKYLKSIIKRMEFKRPKPIRLNKEVGAKYGVECTRFGWYNYPFELTIII